MQLITSQAWIDQLSPLPECCAADAEAGERGRRVGAGGGQVGQEVQQVAGGGDHAGDDKDGGYKYAGDLN